MTNSVIAAAAVELDRSLRKRAAKVKPERRARRSVLSLSEHERNGKAPNRCGGECLTAK